MYGSMGIMSRGRREERSSFIGSVYRHRHLPKRRRRLLRLGLSACRRKFWNPRSRSSRSFICAVKCSLLASTVLEVKKKRSSRTQEPVPAHIFKDENIVAILSSQPSLAGPPSGILPYQVRVLERADTVRLFSIESLHHVAQSILDCGR